MVHVNRGSKGDVMSNCAMCSMAKILDTNSAMIEQLVGANGQSDAALAEAFEHDRLDGAEQHQEVMNSMIRFVVDAFRRGGKTVEGYQFGTWTNMKDNTAAVLYMMRKRVGTSFAVWGCMKDTIRGYGAHWNYAVRTETGVMFYDYQDQTSADAAVASSAHFIPPSTAREEADEYNGLIVLSFQEKAAA